MKTTRQILFLFGAVFSMALFQTSAKERGVRWCPRTKQEVEKVLFEHICAAEPESNSVEDQQRRTLHNRGYHFVKTDREANSFLRSLSKRTMRGEPNRPTDPGEECCNETCHLEELKEYCNTIPTGNMRRYRNY